VNTQTYHDHGKKKKVMNMSKFVTKIDELLDEYDTTKDIDVLEAVIELIEDEIDSQKDAQSSACHPDIPEV